MEAVQEKHRQENESQENIIHELRTEIEQLESEATRRVTSTQEVESLRHELGEKNLALKDAQNFQTSLQKDIEQLRQKLEAVEAQHTEVYHFSDRANLHRLRRSKNISTKYASKKIL